MSDDLLLPPSMEVQGRTITGKLVTFNEAEPMMVRLTDISKREAPMDIFPWQRDVIRMLCSEADVAFLLSEVPMARIGFEKVTDFFYQAVAGGSPPNPTPPTNT